MYNQKTIVLLDQQSSILANLEASLLSLHVDIICCNNIDIMPKADIIIANVHYLQELIHLKTSAKVIIYGGAYNNIVPSNFIILNAISSVFEIRDIVYKLLEIDKQKLNTTSLMLSKLQKSIDKKINNTSISPHIPQHKAFYILAKQKSIQYLYAFIEYLYDGDWINAQIRSNMYIAMHEIVELDDNNLVKNINSLIFTHKNGGRYLSVEYDREVKNKYLLYVLGFTNVSQPINKTTICREVFINSVL